MWREFFYIAAHENPNFGQMADNSICLPISWRDDEELLEKWKAGKTGYPFIDAGLRQLQQEGLPVNSQLEWLTFAYCI